MNDSTKQGHLNWCRERALEYLETGDLTNATTSLLSDLTKHEETQEAASLAGQEWAMSALTGGLMDADQLRNFIDRYCDA